MLNEFWGRLGREGCICCILNFLGNEGRVKRPHLKEPLGQPVTSL